MNKIKERYFKTFYILIITIKNNGIDQIYFLNLNSWFN